MIIKVPGDFFAADLTFEYKGSGGETGIGIGLSPDMSGVVVVWAFDYITLPTVSNWTSFTYRVWGWIPTDAYGWYDVVKSVGVVGSTPLQTWDDDVYFVQMPV